MRSGQLLHFAIILHPHDIRSQERTTLVRGKAISLQTWTGPEGSRRLSLPDFDNRHMRMVRLSSLRLYPPGSITGTHFYKEAESTPGPQCGWKGYVNGKSQWLHRESNPRLRYCVPQTDTCR